MSLSVNDSKARLRAELIAKRKLLSSDIKGKLDSDICNNIVSSELFLDCSTLLVYCSGGIEVSTVGIIEKAFSLHKKIAFPVCGKNSSMDFYSVNSVDELVSSAFGIPAPEPEPAGLIIPDNKTLCILPGLSFDNEGYRLGFGKGFYDRYLTRFPVKTVGICYSGFLTDSLPHNNYDKQANYVVTEKDIIKF